MKPDDYGNTLSYEYFIRRAHKSIRTRRNGADSFFMEALMNAEHGTVRGGNPDKALEKVKTFMGKAFDKFLKLKLTDGEREGLLSLKSDLDFAFSSSQLMDIVTKGLELTQRFKEN